MPTPDYPPAQSAARRAAWPNPGLRVSDAERAAVTDQLAKHYSDGRLDEAEFELRMDKAMRAVRVADLAGLLADLPGGGPVPLPSRLAAQPGGRRYQRRLMKLEFERQRMLVQRERRELRRQQHAEHRHALMWIIALALFLVAAYLATRALAHVFVVCFVLGAIAVLLLRHGSGGSGDDPGRHDDPDR